MTLQTKRWVRKPFEVEAVQVTDRNFSEVVGWCEGEAALDENHRRFISVPVRKPINKRQTTAYVGDFVVLQRGEFKVFKNSSFRSTFDPVNEEMAEKLAAAGHGQTKIEFEEPAPVAPKKTRHGQNGWNTKVGELGKEVKVSEEHLVDTLSVEELVANALESEITEPDFIPGYSFQDAIAAARAGDGNVREQLNVYSQRQFGVDFDWTAPAGHELDHAETQVVEERFDEVDITATEPFNTDAPVTVVTADTEDTSFQELHDEGMRVLHGK